MSRSSKMDIVQITDINKTLPPLYHGLRWKGSQTHSKDRFIAEGDRVVRRALASDFDIASLLLTPDWLQRLSDDLESRQPPVGVVYVAHKSILDQVVGFRLRQGIMAEIVRPPVPKEEDWLHRLSWNHTLVALDGLTDAENVGAIVRNAVAFGLDGLICDGRTADPYLRRSVRVSMGAVFFLSIYKSVSLPETLEQLHRTRQTRIIAATPDSDAPTLAGNYEAPGICLVMGSEGAGLSKPVLAKCADLVRIPMERDWISLNVAATSAILFHELARRPVEQG